MPWPNSYGEPPTGNPPGCCWGNRGLADLPAVLICGSSRLCDMMVQHSPSQFQWPKTTSLGNSSWYCVSEITQFPLSLGYLGNGSLHNYLSTPHTGKHMHDKNSSKDREAVTGNDNVYWSEHIYIRISSCAEAQVIMVQQKHKVATFLQIAQGKISYTVLFWSLSRIKNFEDQENSHATDLEPKIVHTRTLWQKPALFHYFMIRSAHISHK